MYVTELWGKIKVVKRDGTVSDYATGLLNFDPPGPFPGSGEQGLSGIVVEPATGDLFVSMLYEDTISTARPEAALPEGRQVSQQRRREDDGHGDDHPRHVRRSAGASPTSSPTPRSAPTESSTSTWATAIEHAKAQNLNFYRGKILRLNLDGSAPADNPFYDAGDGITAKDYVFASGFRNPFGGAWREADGAHYEVENGPPGRPVRRGRDGPELPLGRLRPEHDELRPLQLGPLARAGEHRLRPARDVVGKRIPDREDGPRVRQRARPACARARRSEASASSSSSRTRAAPSTAPPPCR